MAKGSPRPKHPATSSSTLAIICAKSPVANSRQSAIAFDFAWKTKGQRAKLLRTWRRMFDKECR